MFPCFDQPDIKANLDLTVTVPDGWKVVSNSQVEKQENQTFCFKTTPKISTYLYAIVAGPYDFFENKSEGFPDMRIYARKSLISHVNHEEMFKVTQTGIKFYEKLFGQPYPFGKYDQVFVPEHNYGAMENVGCVTYNEAYLFVG